MKTMTTVNRRRIITAGNTITDTKTKTRARKAARNTTTATSTIMHIKTRVLKIREMPPAIKTAFLTEIINKKLNIWKDKKNTKTFYAWIYKIASNLLPLLKTIRL